MCLVNLYTFLSAVFTESHLPTRAAQNILHFNSQSLTKCLFCIVHCKCVLAFESVEEQTRTHLVFTVFMFSCCDSYFGNHSLMRFYLASVPSDCEQVSPDYETKIN